MGLLELHPEKRAHNSLDFTVHEKGLAVVEKNPDDTTKTVATMEHAHGRMELVMYVMAMGRTSSVIARIREAFPGETDKQIGLRYGELYLHAYKIQ